MSVSIVIPCYNNETTIGLVVQECLQYADSVIVVDDGSTDASASMAEIAGAKTISLGENRGVGYALRYGINVALNMGYTTIVILDGDGAHDPNDIPNLLITHTQNENILTIGDRWTYYDGHHIPSTKLWANEFASYLINCCANVNLYDVACGFRVLDKSILENLSASDGFDFLYTMIFAAQKLGKVSNRSVAVRYDANTLWITKYQELLNLLTACHNHTDNKDVKHQIDLIQKTVKEWKVLKVQIVHPSETKILIAHPLKGLGGYIFQKQHPAFFDLNTLDIIEL